MAFDLNSIANQYNVDPNLLGFQISNPSNNPAYSFSSDSISGLATQIAQADQGILSQNGNNYSDLLNQYGTTSNDPNAANGPGSTVYQNAQSLINGLSGKTTQQSNGFLSWLNSGMTNVASVVMGFILIGAGVWGISKGGSE